METRIPETEGPKVVSDENGNPVLLLSQQRVNVFKEILDLQASWEKIYKNWKKPVASRFLQLYPTGKALVKN